MSGVVVDYAPGSELSDQIDEHAFFRDNIFTYPLYLQLTSSQKI